MHDVIIIGCGIVGAAAAYELSQYELDVIVLEKENDAAAGATKANSAIIHAGYDPKPGSLMARLNVEGGRLAKDLCEKLDVPYRQCGSLVLAFSEEQAKTLERLLRNGRENGVTGLTILDGRQTAAMEPNLSRDVVAALHAPTAAIVNPWEYALALAETAVKNGARLELERAVTGIARLSDGYRVETSGGMVAGRHIVNAAGLCADTVHNMIAEPSYEIRPDRGEYYLLDKQEGERVGRVVFQCPTASGKGVMVSPTVHGNLIVGPNSEKPLDGGDVSTTAAGLEYVRATAGQSVPDIDFRATIRNFSGNRARSTHSDFIIGEAKGAKGFIDLAGICSPGLSAAPAIAKMAVELLRESGLALRPKASFCGERRRVRFHALAHAQIAKLVAQNPAYGRVVCRCEQVTEGEILDALSAPIPPRSVDAVKRRVGAGMGRCQGGFCGPRVVELLAAHRGCDPTEVLQDGAGTVILAAETGKRGVFCE